MSTKKLGDEYELLVLDLMRRLSSRRDVETLRLERDVLLHGLSNPYRFDVVWEFVDGAGSHHRLLFECRSYRNRIKHSAIHAWRGQVEEVHEDGWTTFGVMVTRTGYQAGAKNVARQHRVMIWELRAPIPKDFDDVFTEIRIDLRIRSIRVTHLRIESVEEYTDGDGLRATLGDLVVDTGDASRQRVYDLLVAGELNGFDEPPTPAHPVRREFQPPALLLEDDRRIARIRAVSATVGESEAEASPVVINHQEDVAWMLKDTLTGSRVWFAEDGRRWNTDVEQEDERWPARTN